MDPYQLARMDSDYVPGNPDSPDLFPAPTADPFEDEVQLDLTQSEEEYFEGILQDAQYPNEDLTDQEDPTSPSTSQTKNQGTPQVNSNIGPPSDGPSENPSFMMTFVQLQTLLVQGIAAAFAAIEIARNELSMDCGSASSFHNYNLSRARTCNDLVTPQTQKNPGKGSKRRFQGKSESNSKHQKANASVPATTYAVITPTPAQSSLYKGKAPYCEKCNFHHSGNCLFCDNCKRKGHSIQYCRKMAATTSTPTSATITNTPTQTKPCDGKAPYCVKCYFYHTGDLCVCGNCNQRGHTFQNCKKPAAATSTSSTKTIKTCHECGQLGHVKKNCPRLGN